MLKQIFFFFSENEREEKRKKNLDSHDMLLGRHMSAPPRDSKR